MGLFSSIREALSSDPKPPRSQPPARGSVQFVYDNSGRPVVSGDWVVEKADVNGAIHWYFFNTWTRESTWTQPPIASSSSAPKQRWERQQKDFVQKYYNKAAHVVGPSRYEDDPRYNGSQ